MDRDLDWCDLNASYGMIEGDGFHIMDKKKSRNKKDGNKCYHLHLPAW
jgi:hypothetical protein